MCSWEDFIGLVKNILMLSLNILMLSLDHEGVEVRQNYFEPGAIAKLDIAQDNVSTAKWRTVAISCQ
jgi:hypothetical protein